MRSIAAPTPSRTLRRWSAAVRALVLLGAIALLVLPAWFWSSPAWVADAAPEWAGVGRGAAPIDTGTLWRGAAVSLPLVALGGFMLWQLWRLFGEYGAARVFGQAALVHLRRFAAGVLALALLQPLVRAAMSVALTWTHPPGQRMLTLQFGSPDYLLLLLGMVLLAIAHVMAEAVRLAEEHAGFV